MARILVGSRGSALARWQAEHVVALLRDAHPGLEVEIRVIRTAGDADTERPVEQVGRGVFVRAIEQALLDRDVDLAVHSLKDMPVEQPEGLDIAAVPERHDARDALVTLEGRRFDELRRGARLGTGSVRRRSQLLHVRPDLEIVPLRGNVDTRIGKLRETGLDGVVLALAGLERLGVDHVAIEPLAPETCLPAPGQGALALETRSDDPTTRGLVAVLNNERARAAVTAERAFLDRVAAGCLAPVAALASIAGDRLALEVLVAETDGSAVLLERETVSFDQAASVGARLAERLLVAGAGEILRRAHEGGDRGV